MTRRTFYLAASSVVVVLLSAAPAQAGLTYEQTVLSDNPLGYWQFEEAAGSTALNSSAGGNTYDGTYNGGVTLGTPGVTGIGGNSASFDGSSGFVQLPGTWGGTGWPEVSIEAWVNNAAPPTGTFQAIVSADAGGAFAHFQLYPTTAGSTGAYTNGGFAGVPAPTPNTTGWRHIAFVAESGATRVYVDGLQVGTANTTAFTQINLSSNVHIGNGYAGGRWFKGQIDEVAVYNTALSDAQVAAHYSAGVGFQLVETGGPLSAGDLAASSAGATAFVKDGTGYGIFTLNDQTYGYLSSWFGTTYDSFAGVAFSGMQTIDHVAWGRSNTNSHSDRSLGTYTVQYTQVASPGAATSYTGDPATGWSTLGISVYDSTSPTMRQLRHLYEFPAVNATGVRIITDTADANPIAIDEIEAYRGHPLTLIETGGTFDTNPLRPNLARRPGATPFAPDSFGSPHSIAGLNDGVYGNSNSWIGTNPDNTFAGVALGGLFPVDRAAWGRDNLGSFSDRTDGTYTLQYTQVESPSATTPDSDWTTIGSLFYTDFYQKGLRHLYEFDTVYATGLRLVLDATIQDRQIAIDEFEIYQAVPEPATWMLAMLGAAGLGLVSRRRRRRA